MGRGRAGGQAKAKGLAAAATAAVVGGDSLAAAATAAAAVPAEVAVGGQEPNDDEQDHSVLIQTEKPSVASAVTHNVAPFLRATRYFGPARQAARTAVAQPRRRGTSLHPFSLGSTHTMTAP